MPQQDRGAGVVRLHSGERAVGHIDIKQPADGQIQSPPQDHADRPSMAHDQPVLPAGLADQVPEGRPHPLIEGRVVLAARCRMVPRARPEGE